MLTDRALNWLAAAVIFCVGVAAFASLRYTATHLGINTDTADRYRSLFQTTALRQIRTCTPINRDETITRTNITPPSTRGFSRRSIQDRGLPVPLCSVGEIWKVSSRSPGTPGKVSWTGMSDGVTPSSSIRASGPRNRWFTSSKKVGHRAKSGHRARMSRSTSSATASRSSSGTMTKVWEHAASETDCFGTSVSNRVRTLCAQPAEVR